MIVASGAGRDGAPLLVLGLSAENLRRLPNDEPILKDLRPYGLELKVLIFSEETEEKMAAAIQELIGPETRVHTDPRLFGGSD